MNEHLMQNVFKFSAERAVELVQFSNLKIRLSGAPKLADVPCYELEDTTAEFPVQVLQVPVIVGYSDIQFDDPMDVLNAPVLPEVPGVVTIPPHGAPGLQVDFAKLAGLRIRWENKTTANT